MSQEKEAQGKVYKTREEKELEKVIALENKIKFLDDIVYKTGESVQTMNLLNRCYNDNLALMLARESDKTIHSLAKKDFSQSKSVTTNNVSSDFSKPVTSQIFPQIMKSILKNTYVIALGMYKVHTKPNQTRTPQLPQDIRKTNKHMSFSIGVISTTSISRSQLKSNRLEDRVLHNNSEGKKQQVEDHRKNFKTKMPMVEPISTREPKRTVNQSIATSLKRTVASEFTNQKLRSQIRKQYEHISKTCKWCSKYNSIHHDYGVIAHDGKSQASSNLVGEISGYDLEVAFSEYTSTHFLISKDETPEVLIDFLRLVQRGLHAQAEAIAIACFSQNRSLVITRHEKTPYHIINGRKPSVKFFHIFGSLCYIVRDGENLDKMKEKDHVNSDLVPQSETVTTSNELDLLFSPMFDELLNGTTQFVSMSSAVNTADAPDKRPQQNTTQSTTTTVAADIPPLNIQTTPETTNQAPTQAPTVTSIENINQAETQGENAQVDEDEFINIFSTLVQERGETSS
ncbi:hypothetical protein Tco_0492464 [Tanacetum coccineum]